MRRLWRRAFNLSAAVSALLFVGVCVLWVRSYWVADDLCLGGQGWERQGPPEEAGLPGQRFTADGRWEMRAVLASSDRGNLWLAFGKDSVLLPASADSRKHQIELCRSWYPPIEWDRLPAGASSWGRQPARGLGFGWAAMTGRDWNGDGRRFISRYETQFPYGFLASVAVVPPALLLWRRQRTALARERGQRGACRACGYDLRATPGRCPECGAVPKAGKSARTSNARMITWRSTAHE